MRRKEEELERERSAKQQLVQRIKEMESKLLSGGKNIADRTNKQQRQLDVSRQKIAEQKVPSRPRLSSYRVCSDAGLGPKFKGGSGFAVLSGLF